MYSNYFVLLSESRGSFAKANNFKLYTGSTDGNSKKKSSKSESNDNSTNNMKLYKSLQLLKNVSFITTYYVIRTNI